MVEDDSICVYYAISRTQRQSELDCGLGLKGTMGYETRGCYKCLGLEKDMKPSEAKLESKCYYFLNIKMLKDLILL